MPSTIMVHGVDISALEGWMIKINNNPTMFGSNFARRWFHVGYVPTGDDCKLVISYSSNKSAKEPRGWLYIEDVTGVYCRRDMIEIVSSARTLRFKGETAAEHRLWSESLHKLCNPAKPVSQEEEEEEEKETTRKDIASSRLERGRIADPKKSREYGEEVKRSQSTRGRDREEEEKQSNGDEEEDSEEEEEASPIRRKSLESSQMMREGTQRTALSRRHSVESEVATRRVEEPRIEKEEEKEEDPDHDDDSDSDEETTAHEAKEPSRGTDQRRPSLVDSIKSSKPAAESKASKPIVTPTHKAQDEPQYEIARVVPTTIVPKPREDKEVVQNEPDLFREVRADNNFVEDDWDANDRVSSKVQTFRMSPRKSSITSGGVAADQFFATEDWDE